VDEGSRIIDQRRLKDKKKLKLNPEIEEWEEMEGNEELGKHRRGAKEKYIWWGFQPWIYLLQNSNFF